MKVLKWIMRIIGGFFALILLVLIVGFIYEHITRLSSSKNFKPTGEFINVGDHQLHFVKKGIGGPTVVFEAGAGPDGHLPWKYVQDEIAKNTTTISYDRAGILWSERGEDPKSLSAITSDLNNLLINANCPKPYIVVGHSFAGTGLRKFINDNKDDIAGIVFVDVRQPHFENAYSDELREATQTPPLWIMKAMSSFGVMRIMMSNYTYPNTQVNDSINIIATKLNYRGIDASIDLVRNLESIDNESSKYKSFDSIPLVVLTGTSANRYMEIRDEELRAEAIEVWNEMQKDLLNLSTNSRQILASKSGHHVQTDQPELVIDAIDSILNLSKLVTE
ncbi:MAG: alpha/beta fold hydrolase [Nitrosomonadaceae bacterium]